MTNPLKANQQLTQRLQELDSLFEIGKSVTALLDLEAILNSVVKAALTLSQAEESYLLLVDEASGQLYRRAETTWGQAEVKSFWAKVTDPIPERVVNTREPVILSKTENQPEKTPDLNVFSLVNVPLKVGQTVIGVLGINNGHKKRAFTPHDQELLSALADWAAIAIQNAKLYAATKEHGRDLELINHISRMVAGTLEVEQIPRLLIQRTAEIFEAECGSLALIDRERQAIIFQAAYDNQGTEIKSMKDFLMPINQGIVGLVARTGQPYIVNDVRDNPAWSPVVDQLTGFQTKKVIAVPLIVEGEVLGIIELLNKQKEDFTPEDVKLLTLVASSTAIALKNAHQYAALKAANEAIKQAQAQRIATERWTVLGQAAGNLAHRINNSTALVPIAAQHLQEILQDIEMPPTVRKDVNENLDRIRRNTLYTVELAMALLRRFRKFPSEAHDVTALIEKAIEAVTIPPNIRLVSHLDPDLPPVDTSNLLTDAFVEIITNALKMMEDQGGLLRIASFKVGSNVSIQITDTGQGISQDNIGRIFDMFYTTNPQGLGFGLWWVKTFLEQQNGQITVESQFGEGSTFTMTLPGKLPLP